MKWFVGAATAAALSLAAGAASADTVKVGLIASYTGAFATWGTQFQQAVEAYQAVNGKTVKGPDGKNSRHPVRLSRFRQPGPRQGQAAGRRAGAAREGQVPDRPRAVALCHGAGRNLQASQDSGRDHERRDLVDHPRLALFRAREHDGTAVHACRSPNGRYQNGIKRVYTHRQRLRARPRRRNLLRQGVQGRRRRDHRQRSLAAAGDQLRRLHGEGAAGEARRALHVPAGRLALDRLRQGLCRARPQGGRHQAARQRRDAGAVPAQFHR